jgi:hypothetical protein
MYTEGFVFSVETTFSFIRNAVQVSRFSVFIVAEDNVITIYRVG